MAGGGERYARFADGEARVKRNRLETRQRALGVLGAVQRLGRMVFGVAVAIGAARILLLQVAAVGQQNRRQFERRRGAVDLAFKSFADQARQITAVIQVCVCQNYRVDVLGGKRQRHPIAQPQIFNALE